MLILDRDQATAFVEAIEPDTRVPLVWQTFDDRPEKRRELTRIHIGRLWQHWPVLWEANKAGAGVFLTINASTAGRTAKDITRIRALWVEFDRCEPSRAWHLQPSVIVRSRNGLHVYWLIDGDDPDVSRVGLFRSAQERLIAWYEGADKAIKDLPRVMRVPGTYHGKDPADPYLVQIEHCDAGQRYCVAEVLAGLPEPARVVRPLPPVVSPRTDYVVDDLRSMDAVDLFRRMGHYVGEAKEPGKHWVRCPWASTHTGGRQGQTDTVLWQEAGRWPTFWCAHAHCSGKRIADVLAEWQIASPASRGALAKVQAQRHRERLAAKFATNKGAE